MEIPIVPKASSRKRCARCGLNKPLPDFHKDQSHRDGRQSHCRACTAMIHKTRRYRQADRKSKNRIRLRNKLLRAAYLVMHACVDCGESDPQVLEFDHRGKKHADVATMVKDGSSWTAIEKEIAACEVRCANCHRRKTLRQTTGRTLWEQIL